MGEHLVVNKNSKNLEKVNNNSIENIETLQNKISKVTAKANQSDYNYKEDPDYRKILCSLSDFLTDGVFFHKGKIYGYGFEDKTIAQQIQVALKALLIVYEKSKNQVELNADKVKNFYNIVSKLSEEDTKRACLLISNIFEAQKKLVKPEYKSLNPGMDMHNLAQMFFNRKYLKNSDSWGLEYEMFYFFFQKYLERYEKKDQESADKTFNELSNKDINYKDVLKNLGFKDYIEKQIKNCPDKLSEYKGQLEKIYNKVKDENKISEDILEETKITIETYVANYQFTKTMPFIVDIINELFGSKAENK